MIVARVRLVAPVPSTVSLALKSFSPKLIPPNWSELN